ncbi:MAG: T9SS type A sorting domain-containing protein, partial [Bacteroidales bacterium]|nr:T9SS type A sorting domain-containing protein [Bacteroidales bacterium]
YKIAKSGQTTEESFTNGTINNYITNITYGGSSAIGCTNSIVQVTKNNGAWNTNQYGTPLDNTEQTSSLTTYFTNTGTYTPVNNCSRIFITNTRSLGTIAPSNAAICGSHSQTFTYNGSLNNGDALIWTLYDENKNVKNTKTETYSGNASQKQYTTPTPLVDGDYTLVLQVKDICCGLSIPITAQLTVGTPKITSTSLSGQTICIGETTSLQVTTSGTNGTMSYSWNDAATGDNRTNLSPSATTTYTVTVAATLNSCTVTSTASATITVNKPNFTGLENGDFVWRGVNADWNTESNWYKYSNSNYIVATAEPTTNDNVYIGASTCIGTELPTASDEANVNNLTIESGKTLTLGNNTLNIAGNFNNAGTFDATSGTVKFVGNNNQNISNELVLDNVTFDKTPQTTITAANGITVNGTATFTKGIVNGNVTFTAAASVNGGNINSYINGSATKIGGGNQFLFPVGSNDVYGGVKGDFLGSRTVGYRFSTSEDGFTTDDMPVWWNPSAMCQEEGVASFSNISNKELWNIPDAMENVTIYWEGGSSRLNSDEPDNEWNNDYISFAFWSGSCWKNLQATSYGDQDRGYMEVSSIPAATRASRSLTMGSTSPGTLLPIELVSFTAECNESAAIISWTTATEKNNDHFVLERSADAENFSEIAVVAGAGNSIETLNYSFTDYNMLGGDNYYRLAQVDYDGKRNYSEIISAKCSDIAAESPIVTTYPNPFRDEITISLQNFNNQDAVIDIFDMLGRLVRTEKISSTLNDTQTTLQLGELKNSTYSIRVSTATFVINKTVVKQ